MKIRRRSVLGACLICVLVLCAEYSYAFWIWTPGSKTMINPKFAVKDTPQEQYDWAMRFFKQNDFKRAADEFVRLTEYYPESDLSPEAQYYAGRSYEELAKYYFAFQNYQKTVDNYPYTNRMDEIIEREYRIANIFQTKEVPKLMDLELSEALDRAVEVYKKVIENSPFGKYADKAAFKMAECYKRMRKYKEAIESYGKIVKDYPESSLVSEAKYQQASTRYEASLDPEYDQESTEEALEEFKNISKTSLVPGIAEEADRVIEELKSRKADSMLKIAEFYDKQKKYKGAIMYYKDIQAKFPGTEAANHAKDRIIQLKEKVKD
ncbi:MAG: outer membrane protein assembly factor BamD [Candidatus Omnitrophota bacterium]